MGGQQSGGVQAEGAGRAKAVGWAARRTIGVGRDRGEGRVWVMEDDEAETEGTRGRTWRPLSCQARCPPRAS